MPRPGGGRPWEYRTGKGIFSSPVVDGEGTVYVGSADQRFYAIRRDGTVKWFIQTGEIIDSSALLDDRGRVYFGSGDGFVYCADRRDGRIVWKSKAHSVEEVGKEFGIKTYNVNWFEGNVGMLADGTIIAPNDNYLVYALGRDDGARKAVFPANEMIWSLPAVNTGTGRIFFGTCFMAIKNVYCYDAATGKQVWTAGGLGSNAASALLTSGRANGALVLGGFDGYVRALAQDSGKQLWKFGARDHVYASAAQLSDGTIIVPSADGSVYGLDPATGKQKWAFDTLEPIRSSPAVDGNDLIYVGSGEGRLFCINPDGTLRWSYRCIMDERNDLNASPALGFDGVYVAGENGGVFFVPWDYPLSDEGKRDRRCTRGPRGDLPDDGIFLVYTGKFGGLMIDPPAQIDANEPLVFTLMVRRNGNTVLSALDRDALRVEVAGNPEMRVNVSANRRFVSITPAETWMGPEGGMLGVTVKGVCMTNLSRFGLKFYGGSGEMTFEKRFEFRVAARRGDGMPYRVPRAPGDASTCFEFSRLAAPNPTMLPSWNQIGFDSLHYLAGAVEGEGNRIVLWVIGGRLEGGEGRTVVDPSLEARYPLVLEYDRGLVTFHNYDGFKINFIGSWDMPFGLYRLAAKVDPGTGAVITRPSFNAVALCDEIEFYGKGLKLMGMSEFDTGKMTVYGGMNLGLWGSGTASMPEGVGSVKFTVLPDGVSAALEGSLLLKNEHVYGILLVDERTGSPIPLYYTKRTSVEAGPDGKVARVSIGFDGVPLKGKVRAFLMVDTYPAARAALDL